MTEAPLIKRMALLLMSDKCYATFFYELNFFNVSCLKALLSKCLGLAIIFGSLLVKVPQITKIVGNESAEGVNFLSCLTDLFGVTTYTSYSFIRAFPFSAYGDAVFILIQTYVIAALVLYYNSSSTAASLFSVGYMTIVYVLVSGLTPVTVLWFMQVISVPVMFFGKLTQAYTNFKNGSTGQLSAATCTLLLFGSTARVFTSIQETGDSVVVLTYLLATIGNAIIVAQFLLYKDADKKKVKAATEKKKKAQ